jgi:hypothetical protein
MCMTDCNRHLDNLRQPGHVAAKHEYCDDGAKWTSARATVRIPMALDSYLQVHSKMRTNPCMSCLI